MSEFWVVDTKCKVLPQNPLPQDGSNYYYGRSVVPAGSKEDAIEKLRDSLKIHHILVDAILAAVIYEEGIWTEDDEFEVQTSIEDAKASNEIELGSFVSEKSYKGRSTLD